MVKTVIIRLIVMICILGFWGSEVLAAKRFIDAGDGTIIDIKYGLMWQKAGDEIARNWDDANSHAYRLELGGHADWRLPTIEELKSIIDYTQDALAIDSAFDCLAARYWSATPFAGHSSTVFYVYFLDGSVAADDKAEFFYTRCVRQGLVGAFESLQPVMVDNGDETLTDQSTGRVWQKKDDGKDRSWEEAIPYAEALVLAGHSDWRLPTIEELTRLTDYTRYQPAMRDLFENSSNTDYWSGSVPPGKTDAAWSVDFFGGYVNVNKTRYGNFILCVRSETTPVTTDQNPLVFAAVLDQEEGNAPLIVSFSSTVYSGNPPYVFTWDFGDGTTDNAQNAVHNYVAPGAYTAKITIADAADQTVAKQFAITVAAGSAYVNQPPQAAIYMDVKEGPAPLEVQFTGAGSDPEGQSLTTWWDFGAGGTIEGTKASYTFEQPGTYTVKFTVEDTDGMRDTAQETVNVTGSSESPCDVSQLQQCAYQAGCEALGAYWCGDTCQGSACEKDTAQKTPLSGMGVAVIIAAGGAHPQNTLFKTTNKYCENFYHYLKKRGYTDGDIIYMNPIAPLTATGHMDTDKQDYKLYDPKSELEQAFTEAAQMLTAGQQFVLYIHGHASPDLIKINNDYQLPSSELQRLLGKIPVGVEQIIIIDTCHSGSVLDELANVYNRIVITSSDTDSLAWTAESWSFSKKFFYGIRSNQNLWDAFKSAEEMILGNPTLFGDQRPLLDDDQDGEYSQRDGSQSSQIFIGMEGLSQAEPPLITFVHEPLVIPAEQATAILWIKTSPSHDGIETVTAQLIPPTFKLALYEEETTERNNTISIELGYNSVQDRYEAVYDGFREKGIWKIMYEAQGTEGDFSDVKFGQVTAPGLTLPVTVDTWTNQTVYQYGDQLALNVTLNSQQMFDLYAIIIYPGGTLFQSLIYPGSFSMNYDLKPFQENIDVAGVKPISILDTSVTRIFPEGVYVFGAFVTEPKADPWLVDQWIHLDYDVFQLVP